MQWFRMYSEARNDAKLRYLTDAEFRVWFNLLCFANEQQERGTIPPMPEKLLAVETAGGDEDLLAVTLEKLTSLAIIEESEDGGLCFINFKKRNYDHPSDEPERVKERVRRCRAKKRNAPVTTRNDRVTTHTNTTDPDADPEVPPPPLTPPPPTDALQTQPSDEDDVLPDDPAAPVVQFCLEHFIPTASGYQVSKLTDWVDHKGMEPGLVIWAMEEALRYGVRTVAYVESILSDCERSGIKTRRAAELRKQAWARGRDSPEDVPRPVVTNEEEYLAELDRLRQELKELTSDGG